MDDLDRAAIELRDWLKTVLRFCDRTLFAVATHEPHKQAAILGVLTRNAKLLVHSELDDAGAVGECG